MSIFLNYIFLFNNNIYNFQIKCFLNVQSCVYRTEVKKLLKNESAYHCFCSESRLELLRRDAAKRGMVPKYDNKCRSLTKEEVKEKMNKGIPHCIRFKVSKTICTLHTTAFYKKF